MASSFGADSAYTSASQVLLVIRGTSSLKEVLTDLAGHMVDFALGGHTHNGMLQVRRDGASPMLALLHH